MPYEPNFRCQLTDTVRLMHFKTKSNKFCNVCIQEIFWGTACEINSDPCQAVRITYYALLQYVYILYKQWQCSVHTFILLSAMASGVHISVIWNCCSVAEFLLEEINTNYSTFHSDIWNYSFAAYTVNVCKSLCNILCSWCWHCWVLSRLVDK